MKIMDKMLFAPAVLFAAQSQAAVDVTGFTIDQASRPYGLIVMTLVLVGIGVATLRRAS